MSTLKLSLCLFLFINVVSSCQTEPSAKVGNLAQNNHQETPLASPKVTSLSVPSPLATPKLASANETVPQRAALQLDCGKNITPISRQIKIPEELCFNEKLSSDKSEVVPNPPQGVKQANSLSTEKVKASEVAPEVLQVINLILGNKQSIKYFSLTVSSNGEDSTTRTIKMYLYSPLQDNGEPGDISSNTFYFQKQKGKMKFVSADLAQ